MTNLRYLTAALVLTGVVVALFPQPAEAEMIGLVKRVVDDAYGTPPGLKREEKLPRFPIVQDELLETGEDSAMLVEFIDKTTLTLGAKSHLTVDTMVYDPKTHAGTLVLNLTVGILRYISGKMVNDGVRIITPTAVLGLRGSDALIIVKPDGSTTVNVFSGQFFISDSGGDNEATVGRAQSVSVSVAGVVGAVGPGPTNPPGTPPGGSVPPGVGIPVEPPGPPGEPPGGPPGGPPVSPTPPVEPPGHPGPPDPGPPELPPGLNPPVDPPQPGPPGEPPGHPGPPGEPPGHPGPPGEPPGHPGPPGDPGHPGGPDPGNGHGGWPPSPGAPPGHGPGDPGDPDDPGGGHPGGGESGGGDPEHDGHPDDDHSDGHGDDHGDDHGGDDGGGDGGGNGH